MFESKTFDNLIKEAMLMVPDIVDKRQGSIIYDAIAPVCAELARLYADMDMVIENCFANTASREYLIRRASERGISPYAAENAVLRGEFNIAVDIGARFNLEQYNYRVTEHISGFEYKLECETAGTAPNGILGDMTPLEYTEGLTECRLIELIAPGKDEEETEEFRSRYFSMLMREAFGGNVYDYIKKVSAVEGVGQVRVYRCDQWNGAGTVGIVITNSANGTPDQLLVEKVQQLIDPDENGNGRGIAPIGHIVTVQGVSLQRINADISVSAVSGKSQEELKAEIEAVIEQYINERNALWGNGDVYIYGSQISGRLLDIEGIVDVSGVSLNNASYVLLEGSIGGMGNVEVTVAYA